MKSSYKALKMDSRKALCMLFTIKLFSGVTFAKYRQDLGIGSLASRGSPGNCIFCSESDILWEKIV